MTSKWIHLVEDVKTKKHDVWPSEIRIKMRGRARADLMKVIRKLRKQWRELS
jgi:hypothetical protein